MTLLLQCRDIEQTREFYKSALNFNVRDTVEGTITADNHAGTLIFTSESLWENPLGFSGTIYFTVPDTDAYFASIKDKVTVAWPVQRMSYGCREFGIKDCNGYHLAFQQKD